MTDTIESNGGYWKFYPRNVIENSLTKAAKWFGVAFIGVGFLYTCGNLFSGAGITPTEIYALGIGLVAVGAVLNG